MILILVMNGENSNMLLNFLFRFWLFRRLIRAVRDVLNLFVFFLFFFLLRIKQLYDECQNKEEIYMNIFLSLLQNISICLTTLLNFESMRFVLLIPSYLYYSIYAMHVMYYYKARLFTAFG